MQKSSSSVLYNYADEIVHTVREPLLVLDARLRVKMASGSFYRNFKVSSEQSLGNMVYELGDGQWNIPSLRKLLEDLLANGNEFNDYQIEHNFPHIGQRVMLLNARLLHHKEDQLILLAIEDITERRASEVMLAEREREHERRFREMLDALPAAIYTTDAEGHVTYSNPAATKFAGRTPELGIDKWCISWKLFQLDGTPLPHETCPMALAIKENREIRGERVILERPDGSRHILDVFPTPLRDADGNVASGINMLVDVTDQTQSEQTRHESEMRLAAIVEASADAIVSKDLNGIIKTWNNGAEKLFGFTAEEAIGQSIKIIIPPNLLAEEDQILNKIKNGERIEHFQTIRCDKWGKKIDLSLSISPIKDRQGRITGASKIARDISDHKRLQEILRESEIRYRRLFEAAHDGILILDATTSQITDVNPYMLKLLGYPRNHFVGKELWQIGVFRDKAENQSAMRRLQQEKSIRFEDLPLQDKDGCEHPVEFVSNVYEEDQHQVIQCNIRDISERKNQQRERETLLTNEQAARREAETANRAMDIFLAMLSHEMRTPLNSILGWANILSSTAPGNINPEELKEGIGVIERNAKAQAKLIEDMLDVARIVSGKLQLEISRCDMRKVLLAAIDTVQTAAKAREITLETDIDSHACDIYCDAYRMQQVATNLLSNAIKFTPQGGTVRLRLTQLPSDILLEISDNGTGISAELLPTIFERFSQAAGNNKRQFGGLGLGLNIARNIVELHGGTIMACSDGRNCGSTFSVALPIRAIHQSDGNQPEKSFHTTEIFAPPNMSRLNGLRILIVDDDADARRLVSKKLQDAGANVTTAAIATEALELVDTTHPNLLVSDIGMPGQNGYELMEQIRANGHTAEDLPAIALTGFARKKDHDRALQAGFQVHLSKPTKLENLILLIATLTGR